MTHGKSPGGIGPTHDDITAKSMADGLAVPLIVHREPERLLESHYSPGQITRRGCVWRWCRKGR
jgi:molybdopterin-biosynthesis enzyme MoeA-like protein